MIRLPCSAPELWRFSHEHIGIFRRAADISQRADSTSGVAGRIDHTKKEDEGSRQRCAATGSEEAWTSRAEFNLHWKKSWPNSHSSYIIGLREAPAIRLRPHVRHPRKHAVTTDEVVPKPQRTQHESLGTTTR